MKKLLKILIVLIIIFIVIISGIYYFKSHRKFKFTITDINNDSITGAYLIPDTQTVEYSSFNFYNENGQKLEFSDLSVGNIVYCGNLKDYCFERNKISEIEDDRISLDSFYLNYYSFRTSDLNKTALKKLEVGNRIEVTCYGDEPTYSMPHGIFWVEYLNNVTNLRIINNNEAEADAIDNQDNLMLINATIEEIHDDYLMVSCTNSPKMIKVIYSKNNLSNFKEKQKIAIFFASTNTSTLSGVRIKILE
jgi:hypothetical protein